MRNLFLLQVGTLISDVSRVLVVLLILIFAFATGLASVGAQQVVAFPNV